MASLDNKTQDNRFESLLGINLAILLISTSGVLGKSVKMQPEITIFWRCLLAMFCLGLFLKLRKISTSLNDKKDLKLIILGGVLMAVHWVTYFYSLSLANVAIAILTLHTFPAMTAILEPLILKTKFHLYHLVLAVLVIIGIYIIVPEINLSNGVFMASVFGIASALAYALRNIYTKKVMKNYNGSVMMYYQLIIMTALLSPYLAFQSSALLLSHDWPFVLGLAIFTTCLGHTLLVVNLKKYSAITVSLLSSIIPVYAILWPYLFLNEIPKMNTLIGGSFILMSFLVEAYSSKRMEQGNKREL